MQTLLSQKALGATPRVLHEKLMDWASQQGKYNCWEAPRATMVSHTDTTHSHSTLSRIGGWVTATRISHSWGRFEVRSVELGKQQEPELYHSSHANRKSFSRLYLITQIPAHSQEWPPKLWEKGYRATRSPTRLISCWKLQIRTMWFGSANNKPKHCHANKHPHFRFLQ